MSMENLMKALMESAAQSQQQQAPQQQTGGGDMLSEVLGGLMGGGQQAPQQQSGGDVLSDVLGGLMGGGQQAPQQQSGGDMLSGVLGSLMGGAQGGNQGDNMLGVLEQIIGGQPGQGRALGINQGAAMNMGGMGANNPVMALIQPLVNQLAAKVKIPPQIATMVVSIAVHYLLSSHPSTSTKAPMNLGSFMNELSSGNVSPDTLQKSGMVKDVVQATGLSQQDAVKSLSATFGALGAHVQGMGNFKQTTG